MLSTLHTNTAVGAVTRLVDMGVEPFLLSSSLIGCLAQRLVRVLCPDCRQERPASPSELEFLQMQSAAVFDAAGCAACGNIGYRGRTGIYELAVMDETMQQLIHDRSSEQALAEQAHRRSASIRADGCAKVLSGLTSVQEVLRVTR